MFDQLIRGAERLVEHPFIAGYSGTSNLGALPDILVGRLGHTDIELDSQSRGQGPDNPPLVLQGLATGQLQIPRVDADQHPIPPWPQTSLRVSGEPLPCGMLRSNLPVD